MEWTPEAIRSFKERHCLTAPAMAAMLGITRVYVFHLMNGHKTPSDILNRLLDCLDEKMSTTTKTGKEKAHGKAQGNIPKR